MERFLIQPRPNWQKTVEKQGFIFHSVGGEYWDESACYAFSEAEILAIESATETLYDMCLQAVEQVIQQRRLSEFAIPTEYHALIEQSWARDEMSLYGRFDLAVLPDGRIKMLEFNADTPTSLLEASVIQWFWLQDFNKDLDQFNSIHEKLLERFQLLRQTYPRRTLYFSCVEESDEDYMTIAYLMDCAGQAGWTCEMIDIGDIGWDGEHFCNNDDTPIGLIFKLYPWEFMFDEEFGPLVARSSTAWLEPPWKAVLSNKMILKVLWEMFPGHENLLPCYTDPGQLTQWVRKPLLSREGANITIVRKGSTLAETDGEYGEEGYVFQDYIELPEFNGKRPVVGSWIIGDQPAGIGIRETDSLVHDNLSHFVPHYFY